LTLIVIRHTPFITTSTKIGLVAFYCLTLCLALTANRLTYRDLSWLTNMHTNYGIVCFRAKSVPENIQKKAQRDAKLMKELADKRTAEKKVRAEARKVAATNATKYAKEYADADKAVIDAKRAAKKAGNFYVEAQSKIAYVMRTRG